MHGPAVMVVTVRPATVHTDGVPERNDTGSPDDADADRAPDVPTVTSGGCTKVIVGEADAVVFDNADGGCEPGILHLCEWAGLLVAPSCQPCRTAHHSDEEKDSQELPRPGPAPLARSRATFPPGPLRWGILPGGAWFRFTTTHPDP